MAKEKEHRWVLADNEGHAIMTKGTESEIRERVASLVRNFPDLEFTVYKAVEQFKCRIPVEFEEVEEA